MNNNFKTSLVIAPPPASVIMTHCVRKSMCLTPKLISECRPNSNFSANHDNENDQDNEIHPDNKNQGNNPANKYMFKVNNRKKVLVSLWLSLNIFHTLF